MTRLLLIGATLAAAAATAVPANAATYGPVCVTHLAAAAYGDVRTCYTDTNALAPATRILDVEVHQGAVEATLSCVTDWGSASTTSQVFTEGEKGSMSLGERYGDRCAATLRALADLTVASGVSHFRPRIHAEAAR